MAQVLPAERDLRRVIGDAAGAGDRQVEGLGEQELLELYRSMVRLRTYDERSVVYHSQGRIGTYAIFWNHEAMQAGAFHALADDDWIFPSYRESAIGLLRGMPPATVLSWWRGHPAGWWNPDDYRVASICVPIGTHIPHAAGLAWGKKLKGERAAAIVFFGDGATSEGAFHEGANFAAVTGAPLILFCNNNGWAISTPVEAQTRAQTLADKAVGYGMPGVRVDGTDVLACYASSRMRPPTIPVRTSISSGSRRKGSVSVSGASRVTCGGRASCTTISPRRSRRRLRTQCARASRQRRPSRRRMSRSCSRMR